MVSGNRTADFFGFHQFSHECPLSAPASGGRAATSCQVAWAPLDSDLDSFERTCQIFCRMFLSLSCFKCFSWWDWGFGCEVPFSPHCVRVTCYQHDLHRRCGPDHLVAMVSARFPHCKVTISLFPHLRSKSLSPAYPPFVEGFKLSSIPWQFHLFSPICSFYLFIPFIYQHKLMYTYFLF